MILKPVTHQVFKPAFNASTQGNSQNPVLPTNITAEDLLTLNALKSGELQVVPKTAIAPATNNLQNLEAGEVKYVKPFKPGFIARVRALVTNVTETIKGSIVGLSYGVAAGIPAAGAAAYMASKAAAGQALKSTQIGKFVLAAGAAGGLIAGALVGKKGAWDTLRGAAVGLIYGISASIPAALVAIALKNKGATTAAKGVLIAATAVNTILGAWIGKLIANGKVGTILFQHGLGKNLTTEK